MNNFCKVDVKEKEYNVHLDKDARENLFFSKYNENRLVGTYTATKMILPDDVVATDIDGTSERIYVSCNDKYLRMFFTDGRMLISSKTYSSGVKIVNVTYLGSNQFLIVADSGSGFWGANLPAFNLFYTPIGLFFEDSLYLANAKKLYFGPSFTKIQKTIPYELTNTITVDQECGEIVGLMSSKNNLYIICNNKILLFKHSKEGLGYSLKKIATPYLNIKKTEFCAVGDQGYFISSNILYRFYNDKVEKVDCYFNNNKLVSKNNLSVVGGVLLIPLKDDVSKQTYCYDTITVKECFLKRYSIMAKTVPI